MKKKTSQTIVGILFYIVLFVSIFFYMCCNTWVDNQLEALECWPDEIGDIECFEKIFYICPLSLRWEKIGTCEDLQGINYKYTLSGIKYLECCEID